ncbi:MAG TPA: hypothetical protein VKD22_08915, partial [Ramlibacter sp.]|nr:hypothetical protein [Ramlibacter sp.]
QMRTSWTSAVVGAVQAQQPSLMRFWAAARSEPEPARLISTLARELETIARTVLETLYPPQRTA